MRTITVARRNGVRRHSRQSRAAATELLERRALLSVSVDQSSIPTLSRTNSDFSDFIYLPSVLVESSSFVTFQTDLGSIDVELEGGLFAGTASNPVQGFLDAVRTDAFDNSIIHRSIPGRVVQGGEFNSRFEALTLPSGGADANGLGTTVSNTRGTLAVPKPEGASVGGAATGWFFNVGNNTDLDSADGGYTVFGKVLGEDGLQTLDALAGVTTYPFASPFEHLPVEGPYSFGNGITFDQTLVVQDIAERPTYPDPFSDTQSVYTFKVSSSNSQVVSVSHADSDSDLTLSYPGGAGGADITIKLMRRDTGETAGTATFHVDVSDLGNPDTGFDGDGQTVANYPDDRNTISRVNDVATDPRDGSYVVVGSNTIAGDDDFAIARIRQDGSKDPTFGGGAGIVNIPLFYDDATGQFVSPDDRATGVELLPDGKILFCGYSEVQDRDQDGTPEQSDLVLARLNPTDGSLDTTFGDTDPSTGARLGYTRVSVTPPGTPSHNRGNGLILQPDGKIVVVGSTDAGIAQDGTDDFLFVRFNDDGTLDGGFGSGGIRSVTFGRRPQDTVPIPSEDHANAVAIQSDGKIIAVGNQQKQDGFSGFAIVRLKSDGSDDTSFGPNGDGRFSYDALASVKAEQTTNEAFAVAIEPDNGAIVIGGTSAHLIGAGNTVFSSDFGLVRLTSTGVPDTTFDGDGRTTSDFGKLESLSDLLIESDGSIIATGKSADQIAQGGTTQRVVVAEYRRDGSLNRDFGNNGSQLLFTNAAQASDVTPLAGANSGAQLAAAATTDITTTFQNFVQDKQGVVDAAKNGGIAAFAGNNNIVRVAVLQGDLDKPAVFIQFANVKDENLKTSTFTMTVVDDKGVSFDSIKDPKIELRLLKDGQDFAAKSFEMTGDVLVQTGVDGSGNPILAPATGPARVLVATYVFTPERGFWDFVDSENYNNETHAYTLQVAPGEVQDTDGNSAAPAAGNSNAGNILHVQINRPGDPPSAFLAVQPVTTTGTSDLTFSINYVSGQATGTSQIDPASIDLNDVEVKSKDGTTTLTVVGKQVVSAPGNELNATYTVQKADGDAFGPGDNGDYLVTLKPGEVIDTNKQVVTGQTFDDQPLVVNIPQPSVLPDPVPDASATVADVAGTSGQMPDATFTVRYEDAGGLVDASTIDNADVVVVAQSGGASYPAKLVSKDSATNASVITATYSFASSSLHAANNGTYSVTLQAQQIKDATGNSATAGELAMFKVQLTDPPPEGLAVASINPGKFRGPFTAGDKKAKGKVSVSFTFVGTPPIAGANGTLELFLSTDGTFDGADQKISLAPKGVVLKASKPAKPGKTPKPPKLPKTASLNVAVPLGVPAGTYKLIARLSGTNVANGGTSIVVGDNVIVQ